MLVVGKKIVLPVVFATIRRACFEGDRVAKLFVCLTHLNSRNFPPWAW